MTPTEVWPAESVISSSWASSVSVSCGCEGCSCPACSFSDGASVMSGPDGPSVGEGLGR